MTPKQMEYLKALQDNGPQVLPVSVGSRLVDAGVAEKVPDAPGAGRAKATYQAVECGA